MHFPFSSQLLLLVQAMPTSSPASLAHPQSRLCAAQQQGPAIRQTLRQRCRDGCMQPGRASQ